MTGRQGVAVALWGLAMLALSVALESCAVVAPRPGPWHDTVLVGPQECREIWTGGAWSMQCVHVGMRRPTP